MKKSKRDKVRDLRSGEVYQEQPEILTIEEHNQRVRLAHWYMRKAGLEPAAPVIEKEDTTWMTRIRWLFFGVLIAAIATNAFGR